MSETARPQLIRIEVDRRLGHEWDEWDGNPLPNQGNYDSPPRLFFQWSAAGLAAALGVVALALYLLGPRIGLLLPGVPTFLWLGLGVAAGASWLWWLLILLSYTTGRSLLPAKLAEQGPFLRLMSVTSRVADRFGRRDWVENAAVKVYNALAVVRAMRPYVEAHLAGGGRLHQITRHMLGLFHGRPGARHWRRILSERANQDRAGWEVVEAALAPAAEAA